MGNACTVRMYYTEYLLYVYKVPTSDNVNIRSSTPLELLRWALQNCRYLVQEFFIFQNYWVFLSSNNVFMKAFSRQSDNGTMEVKSG